MKKWIALALALFLVWPVTALAASVAAGAEHALILNDMGRVFSWGKGQYGRLGTGGENDAAGPVAIAGTWTAVAAGMAHTLLLSSDGAVYACGHNGYGQLGDGTRISRLTPVRVLKNATQVAAGASFSAALKSDGTVATWGCGLWGELGNNLIFSPVPQPVGLNGVAQIAAGECFLLALTASGDVYAWGFGMQGQLGTDNAPMSYSPLHVNLEKKIIGIACAAQTAYALDDEGSVWAWGMNEFGDPSHATGSRVKPTKIDLADRISRVSAGGGGHCAAALTESGTWYAWGALFGETTVELNIDSSVDPTFGDGFMLSVDSAGTVYQYKADTWNIIGSLSEMTGTTNTDRASTTMPTATPDPTATPTATPTTAPTPDLTAALTATPTATPDPTAAPTATSTTAPTPDPTVTPTPAPTPESITALAEQALEALDSDEFEATYRALESGLVLRQGEKSAHGYSLQKLLIALGAHIKADGSVGPKTIAALKEVQASRGLRQTEEVGVEEFGELLIHLWRQTSA